LFDAVIQFPEPVVYARHREPPPPDVHVQCFPVRPHVVVMGSGTVTRNRPPLPSKKIQLRAKRVPARCSLEIALLTSVKVYEDHDLTMDAGPFAELAKEMLLDYIDGTFQFQYRGATLTKKLFAPISYDKEKRAAVMVEVRGDYGDWKPADPSLMS
jgi:hypothetical protein